MKSKNVVKIVAIVAAILLLVACNIAIAYAVFFEPPLRDYIEQSNVQKDEHAATDIANAINLKLMNESTKNAFLGECMCERSVTMTFDPASTSDEKTTYNLSDGVIHFSSRNEKYLIDYEEMYQYLFDTVGETFETTSNKYKGNKCIIIIDVVPHDINRPIYVYSIYEE